MKKKKFREDILDEGSFESEKIQKIPWSSSMKIFIICSGIFLSFIGFYFYNALNKKNTESYSEWSPMPPADSSEYLSFAGKYGFSIYLLLFVFLLLLTWVIALFYLSREPFSERKAFLIIIGSLIMFVSLVLFLS